MRYTPEQKDAAKRMYLRHVSMREIAERLNIEIRTLYNWAAADNWDDFLSHEDPLTAIARRINVLTEMEDKTDRQLSELDRLTDNFIKLQTAAEKIKAKPLAQAVATAGGQPIKDVGGAAPRKKSRIKNDVSALTADDFAPHMAKMTAYQQRWRANKKQRNRFILKSRQVGATYYFAAEAFEDAVVNGVNKNFLSASKAQAEIFRAYICKFAMEWFGLELKGNPLVLYRGEGKSAVELRFLSTNSNTAQGPSGDVFFDEVFWVGQWTKLEALAGGMATHKKYCKTYFSTPSSKQHDAYALWSGEKQGIKNMDVSHAALKGGKLCEDGFWREVLTIEDAAREGAAEFFDIDQLRQENGEAAFKNLYLCQFTDGAESVFDFHALMKCGRDTSRWPALDRQPCVIGYDPARVSDAASLRLLEIPTKPGGKFRVRDKVRLLGVSFTEQAARIQAWCDRYNIQGVFMDTTGVGLGVFEMVQTFYPAVTPIHYSVESKTRLVLKTLEVVAAGRIEWDENDRDLVAAFLTVRKTVTEKSAQVTYASDRSEKSGHADDGWAVMHALQVEALNGNAGARQSHWSV